MSFTTVLLLNIFPALLPAVNEEDRDFYEVLSLPSNKNVSEQDIRKAYKLKSLSLHPDKIAQRRESKTTAEEAAKEYQLVQEAHACLNDPESRQKYHGCGKSPTRYRFLTQEGGLSNQMGLLKNLHDSSFADKTKLVLFVSIFPALMLLQPILVAVKVNHILNNEDDGLDDASWVALLIPWWIFHGGIIFFWFLVSFMAPAEARMPILGTAVEQLDWFLAFLLMALRWDNTITADYVIIFVPVYFALIMKWLHSVLVMQHIQKDMSKMVSKDHFLKEVLHGREPEELEEEELMALHGKYVVVHQIPPDVEHELENDEENKDLSAEEKEEIRVSSSREFEAAMQGYNDARRGMLKSMVFDVAFLILLILKVDDHVDMNWWIVFIPIFVSMGLRMLRSCFTCCCLASSIDEDEVVVLAMKKEDLEKLNEKLQETTGGDDGKKEEENGIDAKKAEEGPSFPLNSEVTLFGMKAAEFNGKTGIVKGPLTNGRQEIHIKELNKTAAIKVSNLKGASSPADGATSGESKLDEVTASKKSKGKATEDERGGKADQDPSSSRAAPTTAAASQKAAPQSTATSKEKGDEAVAPANDNDNGEKKEDDDDDNISIHIDEEAYRAYQAAYAQSEQNVMEERVRAGQNSCVTIVQLVMVCLLVAKLQQSYEAVDTRETEGDDADVDVGFNTLWLIFPLFLVVGFMISCCACLIYSAPDPDELMQKEDEAGEEGGENNDADAVETGQAPQSTANADAPIVFAPPPPPTPAEEVPAPPAATGETAAEPNGAPQPTDEKKKENVAPPDDDGDMNDLD